MENIKILFEDKYIIIVEKPVGVMSQLDLNGGDSMPRRISEYLAQSGGYVGVLHRLDTTTGGVITYSKSEKHTGMLSNLVAGDGYFKEYLCVCEGEMDCNSGLLNDFLYHDKVKNKSYVVKGERKGAKEAKLEYKLLAVGENKKGEKISLLWVHLLTGRTHQIRVQLASRGHALCGDGKYGSRDNGCLASLWSYKCEFVHPVTGKKISVVSKPCESYPWDRFDI